eukprot:COSAG02_NODE_146_length_33985_cov_263.461695_22_plen_61_part_00
MNGLAVHNTCQLHSLARAQSVYPNVRVQNGFATTGVATGTVFTRWEIASGGSADRARGIS